MRLLSEKKRETMAYLEEWEENHAKKKKKNPQIRAYTEVKRFIYHFTMIH